MADRIQLTLGPVVTTFGYLFTPHKDTDDDGKIVEKWKVTLLFDPNDPQGAQDIQALHQAVSQLGVETFGDQFAQFVQAGQVRSPLRDGNTPSLKTGQPRFPGLWFANATSYNQAPEVVSRYSDPSDPLHRPRRITDPSEYYWGQKARVNVTVKAYKASKAQKGNGVGLYINGVQLWHEGDKLSGFDAQKEFNAEGDAPAADYPPPGQPPTPPPVAQPPSPPPAPSASPAPPAPPAAPGNRLL